MLTVGWLRINLRAISGMDETFGMSGASAVPGIAEAVKQSARKDVKVTGLSLPNMCKPYIKEGLIDSIVLWNSVGYFDRRIR